MLGEGDIVKDFTLRRFLGQGNYGEVWLADRKIELANDYISFALKFLSPQSEKGSDSSIVNSEIRTWIKAGNHLNIVSVHDGFVHGRSLIIVSEYIEDGSLRDWLVKHGNKAPSIKKAIEMMRGILRGLQHLHAKKIIHRDLKPENILLKDETPKITDFGLSRMVETLSDSSMIRFTRGAGAPMYMPPEAFSDCNPTPQLDTWSAGILFYEMLTGTCPFRANSLPVLLSEITNKEPSPLPSQLIELQEFVSTSLTKDVAGRFQTAGQMAEALEQAWAEMAGMRKWHQGTISQTMGFTGGSALGGQTLTDEKACSSSDDRLDIAPNHEIEPEKVAGETGVEQFVVAGELSNLGAGSLPRQIEGEDAPLPADSRKRIRVHPSRLFRRRGQTRLNLSWKIIGSIIALSVMIMLIYFSGYITRSRHNPAATQHGDAGRALYYQGKWVEAADEFRKAAKLEPDEAQWHVLLAYALAELMKDSEAASEHREGERLARHALELDPKNAKARNALGIAIRGQAFSVLARAEREYREAVRLAPENGFYHADLSLVLFERANFVQAEAESREAIRLQPTVALHFQFLGRALEEQKKFEEAERAYRTGTQLAPNLALFREELADFLFDQKRTAEAETEYKEAERLFREYTRQWPRIAAYHQALGDFLARRKAYQEAEVELREASRLEPNESSHHDALAVFYEGHPEKSGAAEGEYVEAVRLQKDFAVWHNVLGYYYISVKKYDEATAAIREAIRLDPVGNYHDSLGDVMKAQGKYPEAANEYREAIRITPDLATFHDNLAFVLAQQPQFEEEAEAEYRKAIELEPLIGSSQIHLAGFLFDRKRYPEAEVYYREAIRLQPNNADVHNEFGSLLTWLKKHNEAEDLVKKAIKLNPDSALFRDNLGTLYYNRGDYSSAVSEYQAATKLDKENKTYAEHLRKAQKKL